MTSQAMAEQENENIETKYEPRSIREIVKDLSKPIAQKHLRKRRQGGRDITYLAWHDAVKYLDHYAPGWCYEIRRIDSIAGKVILTVRISIPARTPSAWQIATVSSARLSV